MSTLRKAIFRNVVSGLLAAASLSALPALADTVPVYTYHNHPPFVVDGGKGLSYDFIDFLNKKSKGNPSFKIEVVSRAQLDKAMAAPDFNGVVAWVNPMWFKDKDKTTYLWSGQIMDDANVILSNATKKVEYKDPSSLKGKQFGGILGHNYAGIDELVASGAIKREDAEKERSNLRKLEAGRIEVTLLPRSTANYLLHEMDLAGKLYVAPTPQSSYTRHVLVPKKSPELLKFVNEAVAEMAKDGGWQSTLAKYKSK
ncbi:ABC transporter substrate-binding protein [Noviherbaspirillum sp.]|uniref:substrate-binding periplasmic protein n=1 Tax=Noviherbaspirillum sp. TaxID=1926288 RepID=UPI002B4826E1|nr:ABC transporter substrate-binding protein [Noviherbaspirillum sp.]HJV79860.1 ABC transporter substrate-binding protein [Noviherbaspirillum sp.]